ncbi:hypothetical protein DOTSEDRAFT_26989 [Dothistroma septosporum NZE10]|uniref:F-box domain-containing protein n=1 Tax=Dothistroma septosporum (strain NZE10 / CBS 128990) TaxID=675120 RepID=N1PGY1_DOTSN|nr:hypothetical protein DOTSEDRAFT_26989 [Dothistroma septosporum NZE10]
MIVTGHHSSVKDVREAKKKRACIIREDIREAAVRCRRTKISTSKQQANRPRTSTHVMSTRAITMQQSCDAVIDTAELFEAILLQLPMTDLINYRLVNKTWFRTIHGSPRLMQRLFLAPKMADSHPLWIYDHQHITLKEYTTRDVDLRAIQTKSQYAAYETWRKQHRMMRPSILNPIMLTSDASQLRGSLLRRASHCEIIRLRFSPNLRNLGSPNIYHEMFLCQPPVEEIQVQFFYHLDKTMRRGRPLTTGQHGLVVRREGGVKFKDILETFLEHVEAGSFLLPSSNYHIEVRPEKFSSVVYLLGAIFADEGEIGQIEGSEEIKVLSPMAKKMMRRESHAGLQPFEREMGESYWSKEDEDWTAVALDASDGNPFGGNEAYA